MNDYFNFKIYTFMISFLILQKSRTLLFFYLLVHKINQKSFWKNRPLFSTLSSFSSWEPQVVYQARQLQSATFLYEAEQAVFEQIRSSKNQEILMACISLSKEEGWTSRLRQPKKGQSRLIKHSGVHGPSSPTASNWNTKR